MALVCVGWPVGSARVVLCATNLDVDGDSDAHGDEMAMVEFVAVFGTFAFVFTFFEDVRVVLGGTNLDVDGDPDADGDKMAMVEFVAVFGTFRFVLTYFGEVRQDLFSTRISSPDSMVQNVGTFLWIFHQ